MSIEVNCIDPLQKIVVWDFQGAWSVEEFYLSVRKTQALADSFDHNFALILDLQNGKMPGFTLPEVQRALKIPVVKRDLLFIVTKDRFIRSLLATLPRLGVPNMSADRLSVVGTLPEALAEIEERLSPKDPTYQQALRAFVSSNLQRMMA